MQLIMDKFVMTSHHLKTLDILYLKRHDIFCSENAQLYTMQPRFQIQS